GQVLGALESLAGLGQELDAAAVVDSVLALDPLPQGHSVAAEGAGRGNDGQAAGNDGKGRVFGRFGHALARKKWVPIGVHPRRWTDCRLGIDRNLPGFQGWKPWPSTAPTASNSSVRSPWNTLRARPCMRWRSATTCPVILSASGSRSTKLAPSRTTS